MNFNWADYLNVAQELAGQPVTPPSQEAKLRSAVSRAYYAAFCIARNYLRDQKGRSIPAGGKAHEYVCDAFRNSPDRLRRKVGQDLNRLRIDRGKVDYKDFVSRLPSMTNVDLTLSARIITSVRNL